MKIIKAIFFYVLLLMILSSCTVYQNIPIEVLRTKEVRLPSKRHNIAIVYRNFKFTKDTLQNYYTEDSVLKKDGNNQSNNADSIIVTSCLESAAKAFRQNGVCNNPVIFPYNIFPRQTGEDIKPLPSDLIKKLCKPAKADFLILLETFTYFFSRSNGSEFTDKFQQVRVAGMWTVFDAVTGAIVDHKTMLDTVYWNNQAEDENHEKLQFPPRLPAIEEAAEVFGENYAKRFYSSWTTVDRLIFVPPLEDFRLAVEYADNQQWEKAEEVWRKYTDQQFGRLAISACYNLALAHEIGDDMNGAAYWINHALEIAQRYKNSRELKLTVQYQFIILKRQKEIEKDQKEVNS